MAKRTAKELLQSLSKVVGENDSEEYTTLIEDINDSVYEPTEDWEQKYKENDAQWRERYRSRFMGTDDDVKEREREMLDTLETDHEEEGEEITRYEELFKEEE